MNMRKKKIRPIRIILFLIVLAYSIISLFPLIWVIIQSLKTEAEYLQSIWTLPGVPQFHNYLIAFEEAKVGKYLLNTARNTIATVVVDVVFITLAAFAFSKLKFKFKNFFWYMILLNMLIPTAIILIPMYLQVNKLGIANTLPAIVFPYFQGLAPMGLILLRSYMNNIPNELIEAAKIDGCGLPRILLRIIVPLVKPMLVTISILAGMGAWNEYLWALVSLTDKNKYVLSIGISMIQNQTDRFGYTPVFAALTISASVFVILYLCAQKTFVRSICAGAVKG